MWWSFKRDLRNFWRDVCKSPLAAVQLVCVIGLIALMNYSAACAGKGIREFCKDMHVIAEEIRNSEEGWPCD